MSYRSGEGKGPGTLRASSRIGVRSVSTGDTAATASRPGLEVAPAIPRWEGHYSSHPMKPAERASPSNGRRIRQRASRNTSVCQES